MNGVYKAMTRACEQMNGKLGLASPVFAAYLLKEVFVSALFTGLERGRFW